MYCYYIVNIVGNFGTVFVDNAYWQRAVAAHPGMFSYFQHDHLIVTRKRNRPHLTNYVF